MLSQSPLSPSRKRKSTWLIGTFSLTAVLLGVLLFQQGGYLQARVFTAGEESVVTLPEAVSSKAGEDSLDDYTRVEAYCQEIKQKHIFECGNGYPEHDFACRNEEADQVFNECMSTTEAEDLPVIAKEDPLLEEEQGPNGSL